MIEFKNVEFYRGSRRVLHNINFRIKYSERVAILGGSGEGKTTILKLILLLLRPSQGRIIIDNTDVTEKAEKHLVSMRKNFSITFQDGALFDSLNVKENVAFYLREYTKMSEEEIEKRVKELLGVVSVEEAMYLMPEELSGGMQRRVAIARSLAAHDPKMFLYDEPTSDLDPVNAANIRNLITNLSSQNRGFIIVTHEILDALQVAQRFMFLRGGEILFDGTKDEMLKSELDELQTFIGEWKND